MTNKIQKVDDTALPLFDEQLEKDVVGQLMHCGNEQIRSIREKIRSEMFYYKDTRNIFRIISKLNDDGMEITPMLVNNELMKRQLMTPAEFSKYMICGFLSYVELLQHIPILIDYYIRRGFYQIGHNLIKEGTGIGADVAKVAESVVREINEVMNGRNQGTEKSGQDILNELTNTVNDNLNGKGAMTTNVGFSYIDNKGGFQETDLIIVAGATSMGKTSFVNSIAFNIISNGFKVAFYSMEMTSKQLMARILSDSTKIYPNRIMTAPLSSDELHRFDEGVGNIWGAAKNIYFDDSSSTTADSILMSIRRMHHNYGIHGVFVDYLQLIGGQGFKQSKQEFIAETVRRFKNLAKELRIWIVLLSQMNRDKAIDRENPIPTLDRLRDSGQIADAADDIMFVYRPDYYNEKYGTNFSYPPPYTNISTKGTALILIEKGRNRGTGSFVCGFEAEKTKFYDLQTLPKKDGTSVGEPQNTMGAVENTDPKKTQDQTTIQETLPF